MAWPALSHWCTWQLAIGDFLFCTPPPFIWISFPFLSIVLSCSVLVLINPGSCPARESWLVIFLSSEARLLQSLHLLLWATCTHPLLTVRLDKTSHSFRCSRWPPVPSERNLLAILDFFCCHVHYFLLTHPHNHWYC